MTTGHYFGERGPRTPPLAHANDFLFWSRWYDESISPDGFLELRERFDVLKAMSGSNGYLDSLLLDAALLYRGPGRKHYMHADPDRLLHRYDVGDLGLLVYESHQCIMVRVAAVPLAGEAEEPFVRRVLSRLMKFQITLYFFAPVAPGEGLRFATIEDYTIEMDYWRFGIAGAVVQGGLYFTTSRSRSDDFSGRAPGSHPLLNDHLYDLWDRAHPNDPPVER